MPTALGLQPKQLEAADMMDFPPWQLYPRIYDDVAYLVDRATNKVYTDPDHSDWPLLVGYLNGTELVRFLHNTALDNGSLVIHRLVLKSYHTGLLWAQI